ncbi:MAG: tetratricopeptide repeat protein, partial [Planctomycetota bacterium]
LDRTDLQFGHVRPVPVEAETSPTCRALAAVEACEGDYVALVSPRTQTNTLWVEGPMSVLAELDHRRTGILLRDETDLPAGVYHKDQLLEVLRSSRDAPLASALADAGFTLRLPERDEMPFQLDRWSEDAAELVQNGEMAKAAELYETMADRFGEARRLLGRAAWARYHAAQHDEALRLVRTLHRYGPTISNLALEGKLHRRQGDYQAARAALEEANRQMEITAPCPACTGGLT